MKSARHLKKISTTQFKTFSTIAESLTCPDEKSTDDTLNILRKFLCDYDPYMMPKIEKGKPLDVQVEFSVTALKMVRFDLCRM